MWELLSDRFNNPLISPTTKCLSDVHPDFPCEISLDHDQVTSLQPTTGENCKDRLNSMIVAMKQVIQKWGASGQGDGGLNDCHEDEGSVSYNKGTAMTIEFDALENHSRMVLCNCASFVKFNESSLLYL